MANPFLEVQNIDTYLGDSHIIQDVSLSVHAGEVVALLGRNGAGKTTTLKSIMGIAPPRRGRVTFAGRNLVGLRTFEIARAGLSFVQETRAIFPSLSVEENLRIAACPGSWTVERVFDEFPQLMERKRNGGVQLSGGEQQLLAIARALVSNPKMILLDEPSEGLAPIIVEQILVVLSRMKADGMSMLLVEQNYELATAISDRVVILGKGKVRWQGSCRALAVEHVVRETWLGV
jgi:branched-chain amino acid transport system ATP-binding protein